MVSVKNRRRTFLGCSGLFILLLLLGFVYVNSRGAVRDDPADTPTPVPGLVVYGNVKDRMGVGLAGVNIYRKYASYQAVYLATTDANGDYQSDFYFIPGDETITVWAEGLGLKYEPDQYMWRHYYGYQRTECSFLAHSPSESYIPIIYK